MPLSLELCQQLSEAYPQISQHQLDPGDLVWMERHRGSGKQVLMVLYAGPEIDDICFTPLDESPECFSMKIPEAHALWCPRLNHLMELAMLIAPVTPLYLHSESDNEGRTGFSFGQINLEAVTGPTRVATAEEAVARWLLIKIEP